MNCIDTKQKKCCSVSGERGISIRSNSPLSASLTSPKEAFSFGTTPPLPLRGISPSGGEYPQIFSEISLLAAFSPPLRGSARRACPALRGRGGCIITSLYGLWEEKSFSSLFFQNSLKLPLGSSQR
jgi:hypothetical protein